MRCNAGPDVSYRTTRRLDDRIELHEWCTIGTTPAARSETQVGGKGHLRCEPAQQPVGSAVVERVDTDRVETIHRGVGSIDPAWRDVGFSQGWRGVRGPHKKKHKETWHSVSRHHHESRRARARLRAQCGGECRLLVVSATGRRQAHAAPAECLGQCGPSSPSRARLRRRPRRRLPCCASGTRCESRAPDCRRRQGLHRSGGWQKAKGGFAGGRAKDVNKDGVRATHDGGCKCTCLHPRQCSKTAGLTADKGPV